MFVDPSKVRDIQVPTEQGSLLRSCQIMENGMYRLSRRTSELVSVKILFAGSAGFFEVANGSGRPLFRQPSAFTGSFPLGCEARDGLVLHIEADIPAHIQVSWREPDAELK
jgi:hypothetical protein